LDFGEIHYITDIIMLGLSHIELASGMGFH